MFATLPLSLVALLLSVVPVALAAQFDVTVGGPGKLLFDPEFVNAAPGDVVIFTFKQVNHTVSQSTLANPCSMSQGGFDTGFVPVGDDVTDGSFPQAQITVQDTNPIWTFCRQADHCQKGMVFAVNPVDKFDAFKANAMSAAASSSSASATTVDSNSPTSTIISTQVVTSVAFVTPTAPIFSDAPETGSPLSPIFTTTLSPTNTASTAPPSISVISFITPSGFATATRPASSSSTSSIPTSIAVDHFVIVGGKSGQLTFTPSNVTANPGDTITFEFHQTNHSVTASSFSAPCTPLSQTLVGSPNTFDSGFKFVKNGETTFPTWTLPVRDTEPMWAFCAQARHCVDHGMVFSVNADREGAKSYEVFQRNAMVNAAKGGDQKSSARPSTRSMGRSGLVLIVGAVAGMLLT